MPVKNEVALVVPMRGDEWMAADTLRLARARAGDAGVEVVAVDAGIAPRWRGAAREAADVWVEAPGAGSSLARHMGIVKSTAPVVVTVDAHVVLSELWAERILATYRTRREMRRGICCALCGSIDYDRARRTWSVSPRDDYYAGAEVRWQVPPEGNHEARCLVARWERGTERCGKRIGCVMGACYAMPRAWYKRIGEPWRLNRSWGCDEEIASIASWLAGGAAWLLPDTVRAWHAFDLPDNKYDPLQLLEVRRNRANLLWYFPFTEAERRSCRIHAWNYVPSDPFTGEQERFAAMWKDRREELERWLRTRCVGWQPVEMAGRDGPAARDGRDGPAPLGMDPSEFRAEMARLAIAVRMPQRLEPQPEMPTDVCDQCDGVGTFRVVKTEGNVVRLKCRRCGRSAWRWRGGPLQRGIRND